MNYILNTLAEWFIVSKETNNTNFYDLNRIGRFVLRPERNGSDIGLRDAFRLRTACEAGSMTVDMSSESCASLVSNVVLELLEIVALRLWETVVRGLFDGLSDSSALMAFFLDLKIWIVAFWTYWRCAFFSAVIRLRSATFASFYTYLASRRAFRSAFSRATCSLAFCRIRTRRSLFSLASRAFSSLAIAA
jgi:hypothetical protein